MTVPCFPDEVFEARNDLTVAGGDGFGPPHEKFNGSGMKQMDVHNKGACSNCRTHE